MATDDQFLFLVPGGTDDLWLAFRDGVFLATRVSATNVNAECASFTFSAQDAAAGSQSVANAECASFTFSAQDASPAISPTAECASFALAAQDASNSLSVSPECASFTLTANGVTRQVDAECATFSLSADGTLAYTRHGDVNEHTWLVRVERDGAVLGTLTTAVPGPYTTRSGFEFGDFEFVCSIFDPDLGTFLPYGDEMVAHEIALYEDGVLRWKGRPAPWDAKLKDQTVTIRSRTFEYDFDRRFFGWAERTNLLDPNGSFEYWDLGTTVAPTHWTLTGTATAARVDAIAEGTYACELTASDTTSYLYRQNATGVDVGFWPGLLTVATAWGKITSGTVEVGQVLGELIVDNNAGLRFTEQFVADASITSGTPFRMSIELFVAAGQDWTGEVRLYGIDGTIVWDDAEIVFNDATTVLQNGGAGEDLATLVHNVAEYSQSAPWSDLLIRYDLPTTGTSVLRGWEHQNHEWIASAFRQLIDEYGVDIWVGLDRLIHLRNKRGNRRPELAITIDADDSSTLDVLADYQVHGDPSQGTNVAVVTGESHLFAADEAGAQDSTKFGGLTLAKWERAPVSFQPLDLSHRADELVAKEGAAPALPDLLIPMDDRHGNYQIVEVGDVIPVTISYGWVQIDADYRVTMVDTDPRTRIQTCTVDFFDGYLDSDRCASFRLTAYDATADT